MRLEQLRYIVTIADAGSFTLASERLYVAQPSISQAVTALEKELDVTLFHRYRTGAVPTRQGLEVIALAREVLAGVEAIEAMKEGGQRKIDTKIVIGVIPTLCSAILPNVIPAFRKRYPNVTVQIREMGTGRIIEECMKGEISFGMIAVHDKRAFDSSLHFQQLLDDRLMAYVGKRSPIRGKKSITFRELLPYELFLYGDEFFLHRYCLEQISKYGEPRIMSTTHNPETIKRFVMKTEAVGFGPDISLMDDLNVRDGRLFLMEVSDAIPIRFGILTNKNLQADVAMESLLRDIQEKVG